MRNAKLQRMEVLKQALVARAMTVDEMLELLEVSRATLYRLLDVLATTEDLGKDEAAARTTYRIAQPKVPALRVALSELVALECACRLFEMHAGTGLKEDLDALRERIGASLRAVDAAAARHLDRKIFHVASGGRRRYDDRLEDVNDVVTATLHQHRLDVTYASAKRGGAEKSYRFDPYSILFYRTGLYVAGFSHHHREVIKLALDGIKSVTWRRGDAFAYPDDYHPQKLVEGAWGMHKGPLTEVRVRVAAEAAPFVDRADWHRSQKVTTNADGSLELAMKVAGTTELDTWLLSFGSKVEVLAPPELRAQIAAEHARAAALYARPEDERRDAESAKTQRM